MISKKITIVFLTFVIAFSLRSPDVHSYTLDSVPGILRFGESYVNATLSIWETEDQVVLSIDAFHDEWWWENLTILEYSDNTTITAASLWNYVDHITIVHYHRYFTNEVFLYGQEEGWEIQFYGWYTVQMLDITSSGHVRIGNEVYPATISIDDYIHLEIPSLYDVTSYGITDVEKFSVDIRDRPYIPIDLLVDWTHPYVINYTRIYGDFFELTYVRVLYNDLWSGITLSEQHGDHWNTLYIGR